jgi:prolipoprotein diacylglyceryl transferase
MIFLRAYASIWDFVNHVFGTHILSMPPNMYGFMMALAFMVGVFIGYKELKRRTDLGIFEKGTKQIVEGAAPQISDLISHFIIGFLIGWKGLGIYLKFAQFSQDPQNYILSSQGFFLGGIVVAALLGGYEYFQLKKKQLPNPETKIIRYNVEDRIFDILILAMIGGVLGSKLMDAIDNPASMNEFLTNPIQSLTSGLSVLGGLWLAALLIIFYGKKHKIKLWALTDSLAPAFFIAYAVGRLGCQFSGDGCWGIPSTLFAQPSWVPDFLWGNTYAHNVNEVGAPIMNCAGRYCMELTEPHFPTPIYEALMVSALFLILWAVRKRITFHFGSMTGLFMIFNGIERFLIEFIRVNTKYKILGLNLSQAQYISIGMIIAGIIIMIWSMNQVKLSKEKTS